MFQKKSNTERKEMLLLYFELDVFCLFETRVPEFDAVFSVQCTVYTVLYSPQLWGAGVVC
jgi:hypothetical protein